MDVLARIRASGREIECGLATIRQARAAVQAQGFRVDQRRGHDRPGPRANRDAHDSSATYILAAEIAPSVKQAISAYDPGYTPSSLDRSLLTARAATPEPESTRSDSDARRVVDLDVRQGPYGLCVSAASEPPRPSFRDRS